MHTSALPAAGELMHVVQHGFRPCSNYRQQGLDGAVRLANCVNLADQLRMHVAIEQASSTSDSGGSSGSSKCVLEGQLLVCKVDLGGVLQEAEGAVQISARTGEQACDAATANCNIIAACRYSSSAALRCCTDIS